MDKELQKDFQQKSKWEFITLIIILIGSSVAFSELILNFYPRLNSYWQGSFKLLFIMIGFLLLYGIYWVEKPKDEGLDPNKEFQDENIIRKIKWIAWRQNILKYYPLNIIKLRIIPLFICWIISWFINKKYKEKYQLEVFYFPKRWAKHEYEEIIRKFFKSMFRVHFLKEKGVVSYEVKFERDFQNIEIKWTEEGNSSFGEPKNGLYKQFFSENDLKHVKIFTWIFPFGLYWNLMRIIKNLY